jgi:hypothetical protein
MVRGSTARRLAEGPGRGGFGMMQQETKLVAQFDKDGDKRLNAAERKAAREFLQQERAAGRLGRRGPGGPGGRGFPGRNENQEPPQPGAKVSPADVKSFPDAPLYDPKTLRTFFLEFENADWEKELSDFNNTDVEVPAKLTVDGKTYSDVGVHFRGASSFFTVGEGRKRSLNLAMDFAHENQKLNGYHTLNLLNSHEDPTFLRTGALLPDRARIRSGAESELRARRHQRRELGRVCERAAVQQGVHQGLVRHHERRALESARQSRRARQSRLPRRRRGAIQTFVRDQDQGRSESMGRLDQAL